MTEDGRIRSRFTEDGPRRITGRLLFGVVVLALGLAWTLENLGFSEASSLLRWWPALIVVFGLVRFAGLDGTRRQNSGALFMVVGGWLLARELGWVTFSIFRLWPVALILIGASLVWRSLRGPIPDSNPSSRSNYPRPFAFMGGNTTKVESQELIGFEATAVMGGIEVDLNGARPADRQVIAEVFAWWGGIEICVPEDWEVLSEVTPIMGGVENQTRLLPGIEPTGTLVVRGMAVMGGIEIKNGKSDGRFTGMKVGMHNLRTRDAEPRDADEARRRERHDDPPPPVS